MFPNAYQISEKRARVITRQILNDSQGRLFIGTSVIDYNDVSKCRLPVPQTKTKYFSTFAAAFEALNKERFKVEDSGKYFVEKRYGVQYEMVKK